MMLYLRIDISKTLQKVPTGKPSRFFAALTSDAISTGRFTETQLIVLAINCCDAKDASREFLRQQTEYCKANPNACVSIRSISDVEYDLLKTHEDLFDDFMHKILRGEVVRV